MIVGEGILQEQDNDWKPPKDVIERGLIPFCMNLCIVIMADRFMRSLFGYFCIRSLCVLQGGSIFRFLNK